MNGRRLFAACGATAVAIWLIGFTIFSFDALRSRYPIVKCDGIVALTGGADRIEVAVDLLERGFGRDLLISGVGAHTTFAQLVPKHAVIKASLPDGHVTLGRRAISTIGNAAETAGWVHSHHIQSLLVVTAGYHLRRAMLEIHRASPYVVLYPYPIQSPVLRNPSALRTGRILAIEYMKWLGALLRFSRGTNLKPSV